MFSNIAAAEVADKDLKIESILDDKFSSSVTVNGVSVDAKHKFFDLEKENWSIRSFIYKKSRNVTHQLYVTFAYFGTWNWFDYAADEDAKALPVTRIGSEVVSCGAGDCMLIETVGIALDEAVLRLKMQTGYEIKVSAKSGQSHIIKVTSEQIRAQLLAIKSIVPPSDVVTVGDIARLAATLPTSSIPSKVKLGVMFDDLPPAAAAILNREGFKAVTIFNVLQGSVAEKAGLKMADMLYEYDGKPIQGKLDLQNAVAATQVGSKVLIKVLRGKEGKEATVEAQF